MNSHDASKKEKEELLMRKISQVKPDEKGDIIISANVMRVLDIHPHDFVLICVEENERIVIEKWKDGVAEGMIKPSLVQLQIAEKDGNYQPFKLETE
jgi:bifunctional DNA-binding transcriptional regulator/antitoxin component of YhaV-PrlF toxin-antitoxin module